MDRLFAELLKGYRLAAGLTQEALAERAGLSVRGIQALERGESRPLRGTLRRLTDALPLDDRGRARLVAASPLAPRRTLTAPVSAAPPPDGMAACAPPRPQSPRHNLPAALALLAAVRLVTLTGSGGVGKTRLALAVAERLIGDCHDGVWLVELAALAEDRQVAQSALETLGTREEAGRSLLATLAECLLDKRLLLVLDNCEHLVAACAALAASLLRACPGVRILATSREALDVTGEVTWRVPSLRVPDPRSLAPPEQVERCEAVRLFVARARARRTDFALTAQNVRAVAMVCARLDGIPLAIELAARVGSLSVEGIAARLDDRFQLLTGGPRDALPRQRTLRAALAWSYDLLTESEQLLLDRLSVFAGGWTLAATEVICAGDGIEHWEVLDLLGSLVNKSLVQVEERAGEDVRYGLLETVRQYGQERLAATNEAERVRGRHLTFFLALAAEAEPHLLGGLEMAAWMARLEVEHDNLRAALRWAQECAEQREAGMRIAAALWRFWYTHCHFSEGGRWLAAFSAPVLGRVEEAPAVVAVRGKALRGASSLALTQGDYARATTLGEESLALFWELEDKPGIADVLHGLGLVADVQGGNARATAVYEESLALYRELGNKREIAALLARLGSVAARQDNCRIRDKTVTAGTRMPG